MKVLLFDTTNAFLTPGGKMVHALKLRQELSKLGVDIAFSRWWDESQSDCDIIHFLAADVRTARLAKTHGKKTVINLLMDFESNKSEIKKLCTMLIYKMIDCLPVKEKFYWKSFPYFDKFIFMHRYDRDTALRYFPRIDKNKTIIVPHAYDPEDMFISNDLDISDKKFPAKYLVSCANIVPRKQSVLLAQYAKTAQTPIVFIGKGNGEDPYFKLFQQEIDNQYVFYPGYVSREWKDCIERNASGFILLSQAESGCIAVYEAAAYQLPLMLSDLPWAWGYDTPKDITFCNFRNKNQAVRQIKKFYDRSGKLDHFPFAAYSWQEVAKMYHEIYAELLK
jgi:glycosyltransferase involved in cell wall biosynthesis